MNLLSFSNTRSGRTFSLSLIIFTVYTLTYFFRGLSVIGIQMPIILLCYILLLSSCSSNKKALSRVSLVTFLLIIFDFLFIYLQDAARIDNLQNAIGFNYSIFVSFFPVLYAVSGNLAVINRRKYLNFIYLIVAFTAITTILGTFVYDSPCRELATPDNVEIDRLYKRQNIGGYGFIYFIVLFTPILLKDIFCKFSIPKIALLLLCGFCVLRAEYTTALLLYFLAIAITFLICAKSKLLKIGIIVGAIVLITSIQDIFNYASLSLSDTSYMMSKRFEMMTDYNQYGETDDDLGIRIMLYTQSLTAFFHSPLFGNLLSFSPVTLGGHSEILDFIGNSGIFGVIVLFSLIKYLRNKTPLSRFNVKNPYLKSTLIIAIILALINTFLVPELYLGLLVVPIIADYGERVAKH